MLKFVAYGVLHLSWFWTLCMSQVSSPDYRGLFWGVLPVAALHTAAAAFLFTRANKGQRACLAAFSSLALLSFLDLTTRVWLHLGLLSWLLRDVLSIKL